MSNNTNELLKMYNQGQTYGRTSPSDGTLVSPPITLTNGDKYASQYDQTEILLEKEVKNITCTSALLMDNFKSAPTGNISVAITNVKELLSNKQTINIPDYPYGFPSNEEPDLDNEEIVYKSNLPISIELSYEGELLPTVEHQQIIQISDYAQLKICLDCLDDDSSDNFLYTLTSNRNEYTLYELANAVVQAALTQEGSDDIWHTYQIILKSDGECVVLTQKCNH